MAQGHTIVAICGHSKGAVVLLLYASNPALRTVNGVESAVPCNLLINVSGRFDAQGTSNRFSQQQQELLKTEGSFIWLYYRSGPEPDRPFKRPYIITREAMEKHHQRTLAGISNLPQGIHVLTVHGKSDGTVPISNALKIDETIKQSEGAASDLLLLEGVDHLFERPGQDIMLGTIINGWIKARLASPFLRNLEPLIDHLGPEQLSERIRIRNSTLK